MLGDFLQLHPAVATSEFSKVKFGSSWNMEMWTEQLLFGTSLFGEKNPSARSQASKFSRVLMRFTNRDMLVETEI